jgi:type I restriction enzyme S subunit
MQNRHDKDTIKPIEKAKFHLTNIEEQTAIAQLLYVANKEITLFKATAEKLREQKRGLMQVSLTGKIRLKFTNEKI